MPSNKRKKQRERGLDCIVIGYAYQRQTHWFYVMEPNAYILIHCIIKSIMLIIGIDFHGCRLVLNRVE